MPRPPRSQFDIAQPPISTFLGGSRPVKQNIEPYRQGELDSLCGIYAIINAMSALCPEMDEDAARILFRKLVAALKNDVDQPVGTICNGMSQTALERLLATAQENVATLLEIRIKVQRYRSPRKDPTLMEVWGGLRAELSPRQVAILGLSGVQEHWTVAYELSEKVMRLLDSTERQVLMRSRCTLQHARTRFRISPSAMILVKRTK